MDNLKKGKMRKEIIERNVYQFDELSDRAKDNVRYDFSDYHWMYEAIDTLNAFADAVGIRVIDYSIDCGCSARSYVKWEGEPSGRFISTDLTGYCMDYEITTEWNKSRDVDAAISTLLNEIERDYEHQMSDEYLSEHCKCNEYEFEEDGSLI